MVLRRTPRHARRSLFTSIAHSGLAVSVCATCAAAEVAGTGALEAAVLARRTGFAEGALAGLSRLAAVAAIVAGFPVARLARRRCGFFRFEAFDHIDRNGLLGKALDALDMHAFRMVDQRHCHAVAAGTAGASDAMHIVFRKFRQIIVEHMR